MRRRSSTSPLRPRASPVPSPPRSVSSTSCEPCGWSEHGYRAHCRGALAVGTRCASLRSMATGSVAPFLLACRACGSAGASSRTLKRQGQHASAHHGAISPLSHRCVLTNSQGPHQPLHSLRPVDRARDDTNLFACPLPEVLPAPCRPFLVCHEVGGNRTRGLSPMAMQGRRRGGGRGGNKRRRGPPRVGVGVAT